MGMRAYSSLIPGMCFAAVIDELSAIAVSASASNALLRAAAALSSSSDWLRRVWILMRCMVMEEAIVVDFFGGSLGGCV